MKGPKEPPFWSTKLHCGVMDSPCSDTWTHLAVQVAPLAFAKRRMMPRVFTTCKAARLQAEIFDDVNGIPMFGLEESAVALHQT